MNRITKLDAVAEISRLTAAGYHPPDGGAEATAAVWVMALSDVSLDDLRTAVAEYIRAGGRYWPKPSDLRELVATATRGRPSDAAGKTLERRYRAWEQHTCDQAGREKACTVCAAGCPVCQAVRQLTRRPGSEVQSVEVVHDAGEHRRQGVSWVGLPFSRDAAEMYEGYREARQAALQAQEEARITRGAGYRAQRQRVGELLQAKRLPAPDSQAAD